MFSFSAIVYHFPMYAWSTEAKNQMGTARVFITQRLVWMLKNMFMLLIYLSRVSVFISQRLVRSASRVGTWQCRRASRWSFSVWHLVGTPHLVSAGPATAKPWTAACTTPPARRREDTPTPPVFWPSRRSGTPQWSVWRLCQSYRSRSPAQFS